VSFPSEETLNTGLRRYAEMSLPDDEAQIDAKLKETDRSIAELQKVKLELMKAKRALRVGKVEPPRPEAPRPEMDEKAIEKALNMLEWRNFKKKDGEWTFLRDMNGKLVKDLEGVTDFVDELRKGRQVVVGKYRYSASEDKFLNKFSARGE
jgi:hypothetical protein